MKIENGKTFRIVYASIYLTKEWMKIKKMENSPLALNLFHFLQFPYSFNEPYFRFQSHFAGLIPAQQQRGHQISENGRKIST